MYEVRVHAGSLSRFIQVMLQHYSKARRSADRAAAEHLGRRVHGERSAAAAPNEP
jgi:hypothetical protein